MCVCVKRHQWFCCWQIFFFYETFDVSSGYAIVLLLLGVCVPRYHCDLVLLWYARTNAWNVVRLYTFPRSRLLYRVYVLGITINHSYTWTLLYCCYSCRKIVLSVCLRICFRTIQYRWTPTLYLQLKQNNNFRTRNINYSR